MEILDHIKKIPLFASLKPEEQQRIAAITKRRAVSKGDVLFSHGDKRTTFFILLSGQIHIYRKFLSEVQTLALMGKYEFAVESALVEQHHKHDHYGEALEDSELLEIEGKDFHKLREEYPETATLLYGKIIQNLADRLHHANNKLVTIYSTGKIASAYDDLDHLTDLLLDTIMEITRARKGLVAIYKPLEGRAIIVEAKGYGNDQAIKNLDISLGQDPVIGMLATTFHDVLITSKQYAEEPKLHTDYASPTMLGTTLHVSDKPIGVILLGDKEGGEEFSHNNQILLNIITRQVVLPLSVAISQESKDEEKGI